MMSTSILAWIVTYLLHSTILVLGAWLLDKRWHERPERMSAVWKTALIGGVLTASIQVGAGVAPIAGQWALPASTEHASGPAMAVESEPVLAEPVLAEPVLAEPVLAALPSWSPVDSSRPSWPPPDEIDASRPVLGSVVQSDTVAPTSAEAPTGLVEFVPWVVGLLALVAALGLASVGVAFVALRRRLRGREVLREGSLPALLEGLRERAGIRRRVPLMVASQVRVPMAVGVWRPEIVVPPQVAADLSTAHQRSLLAHELAHVLRRDPTWRLVALVVERVLFIQPLNRLAASRLAQTSEYLCDDWAARHTQQPLALASCLTEIATWVAQPGPVASTMAGPRSILGRRVHRLLQPASEHSRPGWLWVALGLPLLALVVAVPGVTAHARGEADSPAARVVVVGDAHHDGALVVHEHDGALVVHEHDGQLLVVHEHDGQLHVESIEPDEPASTSEGPERREARRARRTRDKAVTQARRRAQHDMRRAFREAKRQGEAAPSRSELEVILRRARQAEGSQHLVRVQQHGAGEPVELHLLVPGTQELHSGHMPPEALDALRALEREREMLEHLEEQLEEQLAPGRRARSRREPRSAAPEARAHVREDRVRARRDYEWARAWREVQREHGAEARMMGEALRQAREHGHLDARALQEIERELKRLERSIDPEHSSRACAVEPPARRRTPAASGQPAGPGRVAPPVPPRRPRAVPAPRRAPSGPASPPVVWVTVPNAPAPPPPPPARPIMVVGSPS